MTVAPEYSRRDMQYRLQQGRIGEDFIIDQLARQGIKIIPARDYDTDARQKIDGYWNNQPVQIKLRRSGRGEQNDIAFEVCRNHRREIPLGEQLKDVHQQGRDFRGKVAHYFVMNREETEIYHVDARALKAMVMQAINEMNRSPQQGRLDRPFRSSSGVELRPTQDNDPQSFTPFKVMAFVPVTSLPTKTYPIQKVA